MKTTNKEAGYWRINHGPMAASDMHDRHVSSTWVGDDGDRNGLSVCGSYDHLVEYFSTSECGGLGRGATLRGAYLVELAGEASDDTPRDDRECLIHPTAIVSQRPVDAEFIAALLAEIDDAHNVSRDGDRLRYDATADRIVMESPCERCDGGADDDGDECIWCDGSQWVAS